MIGGTVTADIKPLKRAQKGATKAMRIAAARAAKPVRAAVTANAQRIARHGYTAKSIGTKVKLYAARSSVTSIVGPKMSFKRTKGKYKRGPRAGESKRHIPYLYSWLIERGTRRSRRLPFLQPAWQSHGRQFPAAVAEQVRVELAKLLAAT